MNSSSLEGLGLEPLLLHQMECLRTLNRTSREPPTEAGKSKHSNFTVLRFLTDEVKKTRTGTIFIFVLLLQIYKFRMCEYNS